MNFSLIIQATAYTVIAKLYSIEDEIKTHKLDLDGISDYRQQYAMPNLLDFKPWLAQKQQQTPPQSNLGRAIYYFVQHWDALDIYLEYVFLDINNNFTEQRVKSFKIGRKIGSSCV